MPINILLVALLLLPLSLSSKTLQLTSEEKAFIKEHPVLLVQNERTRAPMDFRENAEAKGYAVDYLRLITSKAGLNLKFIPGRLWSNYLGMLESRQIDLISSMKKTSQRENYALFSSEPIIELFNAILQRKDTSPASTLPELEGKRVAVIRGYYQEELLRLHYPKIDIVYAKDTLDAIHMVLKNEADATIEYHSVLEYNIKHHMLSDLRATPMIENEYFKRNAQYIGIRSDWPLLKSILDKSVQSLSQKELHQLRKKWLTQLKQRSVELTRSETRYLQNRKTIPFCTTPDRAPIESTQDNQHIGISAEYLGHISTRLGVEFQAVPTRSLNHSLQFLQQRRCDFISSAIHMQKLDKLYNFTSEYLQTPLVITTRSDTFFIDELEDLNGKDVGLIHNLVLEELIKRDYPKINLHLVSSAYEGMKDVENKKIFAFVDMLETSSEQLRINSFSNLKISAQSPYRIPLSFAVRKDDSTLFDILEKGLSAVSQEEQKAIYDKWFFVAVGQTDYSLLWKSLGLIGLIALFFIYRYRLTLNYNTKLLDMNKKLEELNAQLEALSQTDQLTEVSNRRHLDEILQAEIEKVGRYHNQLSIILLDIDFFKKINDTYGHLQGDDVLIDMATILRENSRRVDTVGRWGGEEFLIILTQTSLHKATAMAENLHKKIHEHDFGLGHPVTASMGVAEFIPGESEASFLSRADENLYEAKETGRDRIVAS